MVPRESVRTAGTNTLYALTASTYRKGFSRVTGARSTVVYGGLGKVFAGAFCAPTKTMFQLEPVQLDHSVFRDSHCCCEPDLTCPSIFVSAM